MLGSQTYEQIGSPKHSQDLSKETWSLEGAPELGSKPW